ncbi:MAG: histidine kinase [Pyrinomonadaceae bacterium]
MLPKDRLNNFWLLQIGGWLIYLVLIYITFFSVAAEGSFLRLLHIKTFRTIIGFALTCALWRIYRRIVGRYSFGKIVLVVIVSSVIFGCLWTALESLYGQLTSPTYDFYAILPRMPRIALDYSVTIMAWSAIYFGIKYWQQWQRERENTLQATILAEKAQLEMLRYQLNPHFLFNALNSIRASVDEDGRRAKQMITQLSEFLRHSLLSGETKEIPLREELEAVENYLAIEKIRFEDKLETSFEVDEKAKDFKVPCFLLNPLVENAIKHGLQTSPKPLKIRISARTERGKLLIEVANTGKLEKTPDSNGTGIGLKNVRERLEKLFPGKSSFRLREADGLVSANIEIRK